MLCHRFININADSFSTLASQTLSTSYFITEVSALVVATLRAARRRHRLVTQALLFHIKPSWALKRAKKKKNKERIRASQDALSQGAQVPITLTLQGSQIDKAEQENQGGRVTLSSQSQQRRVDAAEVVVQEEGSLPPMLCEVHVR